MLPSPSERNPYVGPRPFERTEEDRLRFFGRDQEALEIVSLIFSHPIVVVYAQSGAGKTSLLNAEIAPELEKKKFQVLPLARVSGGLPEGISLQSLDNPYIFNTIMSLTPDADPDSLINKQLADFLREWSPHAEGMKRNVPRAVIFDQFEEVFIISTKQWKTQQEHFFYQVNAALAEDPQLRVVFVLREDQLAQLDPFTSFLPENLRTRFRLEGLRREQALAAIIGPVKDTGRRFANGVAEQLVDNLLQMRTETPTGETIEVTGEFVEPVQLQVVCRQLWQSLPREVTEINELHLAELADVDRVLAKFYEDAIEEAARRTTVHPSDLRWWCGSHLITETHTRGFVHKGVGSTQGMPNSALATLESHHLIRSVSRAGATWYELTHDRFVAPIEASNKVWNKKREKLGGRASKLLWEADREFAKPDYEKALSLSNEAARLGEQIGDWDGLARALSSVGDAYANLKKQEDALEAYRQALRRSDQMRDQELSRYLLSQIGYAYHDLEDYPRAIETFTSYISLFQDDAFGYERRADAEWYSEQYCDAVKDYTKAIELNSDSASAYDGRGQAYAEMGQYRNAIADLDKALELSHGDPVRQSYAHIGRALAYGGLRHFKRALKEFRASVKTCPNKGWAYYNRALIEERMGEQMKAIADFKTALKKQDPRLSPLKRQKAETRLTELKMQRRK